MEHVYVEYEGAPVRMAKAVMKAAGTTRRLLDGK
jgi:hypothetical protein